MMKQILQLTLVSIIAMQINLAHAAIEQSKLTEIAELMTHNSDGRHDDTIDKMVNGLSTDDKQALHATALKNVDLMIQQLNNVEVQLQQTNQPRIELLREANRVMRKTSLYSASIATTLLLLTIQAETYRGSFISQFKSIIAREARTWLSFKFEPIKSTSFSRQAAQAAVYVGAGLFALSIISDVIVDHIPLSAGDRDLISKQAQIQADLGSLKVSTQALKVHIQTQLMKYKTPRAQ